MTDYHILELIRSLQHILVPVTSMLIFGLLGLQGWRIWVKHKFKGVDQRKLDRLIEKIDNLERKLDTPQTEMQVEERLRNLEDIVVSREIEKR